MSVDAVEAVHRMAIARYGGTDGLRSRELLESAVETPKATFGGVSPYSDMIEIGAAYLFYLCSNHPFLDGNKRVALGACLLFLKLNNIDTAPDSEKWEQLTLAVASGKYTREETTESLRRLIVSL